MAAATAEKEPTVVIPQEEVRRFVFDALRTYEAPVDHASIMADILLAADYRGHFSHGLNRLQFYVDGLKCGSTSVTGTPKVVTERAGTAVVDGCKLFGPVVGLFALQVAISKARQAGVAWVAVRNSNHFGIAAYYTMKAAQEGLIGMAMTTTTPLVFPPRSTKHFMGTNAVSIAAPGLCTDEDFLFDGAMSTVAIGKVEMALRKGQQIPAGWGVDRHGQPCTDSNEVLNHGGLTPIGGTEETGGYKGSALAQAVEIFCGLLSGGRTSDQFADRMSMDESVSHCFVVIDPSAFVPNFRPQLSDFLSRLRALDTFDDQPILAPGDPERQHMAKCDRLGGIPFHVNLVSDMNRLAKSYNIRAMQSISERT